MQQFLVRYPGPTVFAPPTLTFSGRMHDSTLFNHGAERGLALGALHVGRLNLVMLGLRDVIM